MLLLVCGCRFDVVAFRHCAVSYWWRFVVSPFRRGAVWKLMPFRKLCRFAISPICRRFTLKKNKKKHQEGTKVPSSPIALGHPQMQHRSCTCGPHSPRGLTRPTVTPRTQREQHPPYHTQRSKTTFTKHRPVGAGGRWRWSCPTTPSGRGRREPRTPRDPPSRSRTARRRTRTAAGPVCRCF